MNAKKFLKRLDYWAYIFRLDELPEKVCSFPWFKLTPEDFVQMIEIKSRLNEFETPIVYVYESRNVIIAYYIGNGVYVFTELWKEGDNDA